MRLILVTLLLAVLVPSLGLAEKRLGLVIGNDAYTEVPALDKARGDAEAISDTLTTLGFEITTVLDATRRDMNRSIGEFTARLQPGDTALVFFAGHGVEIEGENYLLPVDIAAPGASGEDFVKFESIALSDLLRRVQTTGARTTLMFLDACRDNPFAGGISGRSIGGTRGLARVTAPEGTFIVFSAGARQQALDRLNPQDNDRNSVFTRLLLPKLRQPDLELRKLVSDLRVEVRDLALTQNHAQFPAYYDELLGDFYFASTRGLAPAPPERDIINPTEREPATNPAISQVHADFKLARELNTVEAYQAFLDRYQDQSDDLSITLAQQLLSKLQAEDVATAPSSDAPDVPGRQLIDRADIIRQTQRRLNELGCDAGPADGVIGTKTRRAFAAFVSQSDTNLDRGALGRRHALEVLEATAGPVCKPVAKGPASLAGTWRFVAQCPLFIQTTGTARLTTLGPGHYHISKSDNLGQSAVGEVYETDGRLTENSRWSTGVYERSSSTVSQNRRSIKGSNSLGCSFVGTKVN